MSEPQLKVTKNVYELLIREKQRRQEIEMWIATNVARARGIAESMTKLPPDARLEGIEENCTEIVQLLKP